MSKSIPHDFNALSLLLPLFLISSSILSPHMPVASASSSSSSHFHRRDPLQRFKYYDGGYDLRSKHYWASAAFTGVHGYAMAGAWMVCGLGFGIFLIAKNVCSHGSSEESAPIATANHSELSYYLLFLLIVLFSLLAMVATGFAIAENHKTLQRTRSLKDTVLGAGDEARITIRKVNKAINHIQTLLCPYDQSTCFLLNITSHRLGRESRTIRQFIKTNGHSIDQAISTSYIANLVVVTVNLLLLVAGLVLILLHWHPGLVIIIFLCWILTMACWFLTGIDFFVHNFAEDTCSALEDFNENPINSSLSSLLPCAEALKSQSVMVEIGKTVHDFITELNLNINVIPKELGLDEGTYENVMRDRKICDPFSGPPDYLYLAEKCSDDAIPIYDLPNLLARFTCDNGTSFESCKNDGKFLPQATYLMAYAYIESIQKLIDIYPDLENLIQCSFVKIRIFDVISHQCEPFKVSTHLLWASMLSLSISMVIVVSLWVAKAYQDRGRSFSRCSIIPRHEEL